MELYYPVKNPIDQQNLFGTPSPMYTGLGQKGHPGIDFECPSGTKVYAPCDGGAFYVTDFAYLVQEKLIPADAVPENAGCGIYIRTPNNGDPMANIILWHMVPKDTEAYPYQIPTDGSVTQVTAGQFLGYSDNSGYPIESTGSHLHVGYMPCDETGEALQPNNGFKGCEDPMPLFNGKFAEDIATEEQIVQKSAQLVKLVNASPLQPEEKLSVWQKVEELLQTLL